MNESSKKTIKRRIVLASILSPIVGEVVFLIAFYINSLVEVYFNGPNKSILGDEFTYFFVFPIIFFVLLIFQFFILVPVFNNYRNRNKLNKTLIKKITAIIILIFSLITLLLTGEISSSILSFLLEMLSISIAWSFYFIPNMITYYLLSVKKIIPK